MSSQQAQWTVPVPVILCDSQPLFRWGLKAVLEHQGQFHVVGEAGTAEELIALLNFHQAQLVLVDLSIAQTENYQLLKWLQSRSPAPKVVLIVPHQMSPADLISAIQGGVVGCLLRDSPPHLVLKALQAVLAGSFWIPTEITSELISKIGSVPPPVHPLTKRELQILSMIARGMSNKEIARQLHLSLQTVKGHVSRLLRKLRVRNRMEAAKYAKILLSDFTNGKNMITLSKAGGGAAGI